MTLDEFKANLPLVEIIGKRVALTKKGHEYEGLCPFHSEKTPSFKVNENKGFYHCFGCGEHGNALDFVMKTDGLELIPACIKIGEEFNLPCPFKPDKPRQNGSGNGVVPHPVPQVAPPKPAAKEDQWTPLIPPPKSAPKADFRHQDFGKPRSENIYEFKSTAGQTLFYEVRFIDHAGKKQPRCRIYGDLNGKLAWHWKQPTKNVPLYGLDRLAASPNAEVLLVEGCRKADQMQGFGGRVALGYIGTGKANIIDVQPLKGRNVVIWPDADPPNPKTGIGVGQKAAEAISASLLQHPKHGQIARSCRILPVLRGVPSGFDAADALQLWTNSQVTSYIETGALPEVGIPDAIRPMGMSGEAYHYYSTATGRIHRLTADKHRRLELQAMLPEQSWMRIAPSPKPGEVDWSKVAELLTRECNGRIFDKSTVRGAGVWPYDRGLLAHLGNRIALSNAERELWDVPDKEHVYVMSGARWDLNRSALPDVKDTRNVLAAFRYLNWGSGEKQDLYGTLLAGWTVVAPLCGVLTWRPHIWLTGSSTAGKSWVLEHMVVPLMGNLPMYVQGNTTEAYIRQKMGADARPVVFDEAEPDSQAASARMQAVLELARAASSSKATVGKGGGDHNPIEFNLPSCMCFSSVGPQLMRAADKTRFTVLPLADPINCLEPRGPAVHFANLRQMVRPISTAFGNQLVARSIHLWDVLQDNVDTASGMLSRRLGDRRAAVQLGLMFGGAWLLANDKPIDKRTAQQKIDAIKDWMLKEVSGVLAGTEERDSDLCLQSILSVAIPTQMDRGFRVPIPARELVQRLIAAKQGRNLTETDVGALSENAEKALAGMGILVGFEDFSGSNVQFLTDGTQISDPEQPVLYVANQSGPLSSALAGTAFAGNWPTYLKRIEGAETSPNPLRFGSGRGAPKVRATRILLLD